MKKVIISGLVYLIAIAMFSGCADNAIPYDLSNPDLQIDTITVNTISGGTYYTPPLMGSVPALYFGTKDGFENQFSLLSIYPLSLSGSSNFLYQLIDSTKTIDSMIVTFTASDDTLLTSTNFDLYYFPAGGDSVFSEESSNYLNLTANDVSGAQMIGNATFTQAQPDSNESIYPKLNFRLEPLNEILAFLADTVDTKNRTFMLKNNDLTDEIIAINSREALLNYPVLNVYYKTETDTLTSTYRLIKDLTIVNPAPVNATDLAHISIGRALGLKSIIQFDFNEFNINSTTMIIRTAELVFNQVDESIPNDFIVNTAILQDSIAVEKYWEIGEDEYLVEASGPMTGIFIDGKMTTEIRQFIQGVNTGSYNNYGLKLYADADSDPFKTIHLLPKDDNSLETNPYLRITYVTP